MDPIESWMDAEAVRRLAGRLISPVERPGVVAPEDAGFASGFVGFVAPRESSRVGIPPEAVSPPVPVPAPAVVSPVPPAASPAVPDPVGPPKPFLSGAVVEPSPDPLAAGGSAGETGVPAPVEGKLVARLEHFRDWLVARFAAKGAFILDRDGDPVLDDPAYSKLHFLARSLAQAYRPVKGEPGNVHVKIGSASYLAVIPVETAFGCLVLGAVLPEPMEVTVVGTVIKALESASQPARR